MKTKPKLMGPVEDWLREIHHTPYPVEVRYCRKIAAERSDPPHIRRTGYFALTWREGRGFIIRISLMRHHDVGTMIDTLIHEWAHCVSWRHEAIERKKPEEASCHDEEWGIAYARIYKAYVDDGGSKLCRAKSL